VPVVLFLFEPKGFLNRAFMEFIGGKERERAKTRVGLLSSQVELRLIRRPATRLRARQQQRRSPGGIADWVNWRSCSMSSSVALKCVQWQVPTVLLSRALRVCQLAQEYTVHWRGRP
jgi:hypothetical protein